MPSLAHFGLVFGLVFGALWPSLWPFLAHFGLVWPFLAHFGLVGPFLAHFGAVEVVSWCFYLGFFGFSCVLCRARVPPALPPAPRGPSLDREGLHLTGAETHVLNILPLALFFKSITLNIQALAQAHNSLLACPAGFKLSVLFGKHI